MNIVNITKETNDKGEEVLLINENRQVTLNYYAAYKQLVALRERRVQYIKDLQEVDEAVKKFEEAIGPEKLAEMEPKLEPIQK